MEQYASFLQRALARIIDYVFIAFIGGILALLGWAMAHIDTSFFVLFGIPLISAFGISTMLYFAMFHASHWQATPGKKLMNIYVVDIKGRQLSLIHAVIRALCECIIAGVLVTLSLLLVSIHHPVYNYDAIPEWVGWITVFFMVVTVFITHRRQTIYDIVARTVVLKEDLRPQSRRNRLARKLAAEQLVQGMGTPKAQEDKTIEYRPVASIYSSLPTDK